MSKILSMCTIYLLNKLLSLFTVVGYHFGRENPNDIFSKKMSILGHILGHFKHVQYLGQ